MRLLIFSASMGTPLLYQDFGRRDNGTAEQGTAYAARLFHLNKLLVQAHSEADDDEQSHDVGTALPTTSSAQGYPTNSSGFSTVLGAGIRRHDLAAKPPTGPADRSQFAIRQWHLDSEQWHVAENRVVDVLLALSVPAGWDPQIAEDLTRGLQDAFVRAHRAQLLPLAAVATATTIAPPPSIAFRAPPGGAVPLLTLQAVMLLCRLAQRAVEALASAGLRPCWLYVAHVDSFMGAAPKLTQPVGTGGKLPAEANGPGPHGDSGRSAGGAELAAKKQKKSSSFKAMLSALRKKISRKDGSERGAVGGGGGGTAGGRAAGLAELSASEPGPVGHLQHLVQAPEALQSGLGCPHWNPTSVAAVLRQVRPPPGEAAGGASYATTLGGKALGDLDGEAAVSFPELEDVELAMEVDLGDSSQLPRCVSLVAVRLGHVLAVMAQLGEGQQHQGETAGGTDKKLPPLGTISQVRALLRPYLVPLSSLFHWLAHWAPQEDVARHRMLVRLLE